MMVRRNETAVILTMTLILFLWHFWWIRPLSIEPIQPCKRVEWQLGGETRKTEEWGLKIVLFTLFQGQQITEQGTATFHR